MKRGYIHNIIKCLLTFLPFAFGLASCDVHEFPEIPEKVQFNLRLKCDITATNITEWNHIFEDDKVIEQGVGETYDNTLEHGYIRYVVRAYPIKNNQRTAAQDYTQEFVFEKELADGYDHSTTLDLAPGDYNIMVWADLIRHSGDTPLYNADNFSEITLQGKYQGNNDYRDAFKGSSTVSLPVDFMEHEAITVEIDLQRPLAKFEFITNDLTEFFDKEVARADAMGKTQSDNGDDISSRINIEDYNVVVYYVGFMPNAYSMFTDKPVDSTTGVLFESTLSRLSETEASVGFDYVFVNGTESAVTIQIGIYDKDGTLLSMTAPITVPLKRSFHTIMRGMFLMSETSGGVSIKPEFDGDHNLIFP